MAFNIFLAYRRQDTGEATFRVYDRLVARFGRGAIFADVDVIPVGVDFVDYLATTLQQANLVVAMFGDDWFGSGDHRRRIDEPFDYLRVELEIALKARVPLLPVLVDGATMPARTDLPQSIAEIADLKPLALSTGKSFDRDASELERRVGELTDAPNEIIPPPFMWSFIKGLLGSRARTSSKLPSVAIPRSTINVPDSQPTPVKAHRPIESRDAKLTLDVGRYIFVSYAREDKEFTARLATELRGAGIRIWMDELDLKVGQPWDVQLERALKNAAAYMIVMSPIAVESDPVRDELSYALDHKKPVIPVLIDQCDLPLRIRRIQYADFLKPFDVAFRKLVQDLSRMDQPAVV